MTPFPLAPCTTIVPLHLDEALARSASIRYFFRRGRSIPVSVVFNHTSTKEMVAGSHSGAPLCMVPRGALVIESANSAIDSTQSGTPRLRLCLDSVNFYIAHRRSAYSGTSSNSHAREGLADEMMARHQSHGSTTRPRQMPKRRKPIEQAPEWWSNITVRGLVNAVLHTLKLLHNNAHPFLTT